MVDILIEVIDRLRTIPGLGFLYQVQRGLMLKKSDMEYRAKKIRNMKRDMEVGVRRAKEIPGVLKGSKKRA